MKTFLCSLKLLLLETLLFFNICFGEDDFELKLGAGLSKSSYHIETFANSILKWDDMNTLNYFMNLYYKPTDSTKFMFGVNYGLVLSGVMTDDDMENSITPECAKTLCSAVYSRTKNIKGETLEIDLLMQNVIGFFEISEFSIISGISYKNFFYKPSGVYQILIDIPKLNLETNVSDMEVQHTNFIVFGPTLGFGFKRETNYLSFEGSLLGFVSLYGNSKQTKWGYEWVIKDGAGKIFGIDLNINTEIQISQNMWFGIGASVNYLKGEGLTECGTKQSDACYGSIKSLEHLKTGINLNLKFK